VWVVKFHAPVWLKASIASSHGERISNLVERYAAVKSHDGGNLGLGGIGGRLARHAAIDAAIHDGR
jgi:hypothetical protein